MDRRQLAALIIWWCEGTKARKDKRWKNSINSPIEVTNTNPQLIKIFMEFLTHDLQIDIKRIKAQIQIHEGDNKVELENYWSSLSKIPLNQFNKTIVRQAGNKMGKTKGTFKIRLYDKMLYNKLYSLLENEIVQLIGE